MSRCFRIWFSRRIPWSALPLLALTWLLSSAPALALVCPAPQELQVVDGWWSAPGGWQQDRSYKKPLPTARITDFSAASYEGHLRGPGKLMCLYEVSGQAGAEFTKISHPTSGGPMDFNWDCPPTDWEVTCTCVGLKLGDCEVRD